VANMWRILLETWLDNPWAIHNLWARSKYKKQQQEIDRVWLQRDLDNDIAYTGDTEKLVVHSEEWWEDEREKSW
jgi:hypothetical protein